MAIGMVVIVLLSACIVYLIKRSYPLRADANTLYTANSSEDLSLSSLKTQWHWQELNLPDGGTFVVAPYHPKGEDIEVDAQIKYQDLAFQNDDTFGIIVGMNNQGNGYVCGGLWIWLPPIASYPGWDTSTIKGETAREVDFSNYVTITVKIQKSVITLLYDGKFVARATASAYPVEGMVGLFVDVASGAQFGVQSFRVEKLS